MAKESSFWCEKNKEQEDLFNFARHVVTQVAKELSEQCMMS